MSEVVLILAPHTDDGELGCGATLSKLVRYGADIYYVAFSSCQDSLPEGAGPDCLIKEMQAATTVLGIPQENVKCLDFKVRHFEDHRQEILDSMSAEMLEECYTLAAKHNKSIEIHACLYRPSVTLDEEGLSPSYIRMLSIAKKCGCKFHFASDSHCSEDFIGVHSLLERGAERAGICENDLWHLVQICNVFEYAILQQGLNLAVIFIETIVFLTKSLY
jgi:hypothetical protein